MARGQETLEPKYEPGRSYLVDGLILNELIRSIRRNRPIAGQNLEFKQEDDGIRLDATITPADPCPFGEFFQKVVGESRRWFIRGGVVTGGTGNITIADTDIGSVDPPPSEGERVWLEASITGVTEDDVLLPGGNLTVATIEHGSAIPDNILPTAGDPLGTLYVDLGEWHASEWRRSGCGNFQISHCPGSLFYTRG